MPDAETRLAAFAAELTYDAIPADVRAHARLVIADTLAAIVGGSTDPDIDAFVMETCTSVSGPATVVGQDTRTTPYLAAFANGAAGTVLELDEGHKYAGGHPAIHVLPALFADAETADRTREEFLTAFVAGYEAAARAGRACYPLADGYHPHGVWGAVGTALAVATYRGYDVDGVLRAARVAAKDVQHTLMAAATEGATVRQAFAGRANLDGLLAADLASAGFTGVVDGVARHLSLAASEFDRAALAADLGETWEVTRGYFKRHAACRYTHPALDAVDTLADDGITKDTVVAVRVETYPTAADLTESLPENALQAKFSVPFAVATRIVNGTSGKEAFVDAAIDEETLALAERVEVVATEEMRARLPDQRSARVVVETQDGRTRSETVTHAAGGAENPFSEVEIREKFDSLTEPVLGNEAAEALWTTTREGAGTVEDVLDLTRG